MVFQELCAEKEKFEIIRSMDEHPLLVHAFLNSCQSKIKELTRKWWDENHMAGYVMRSASEGFLCVGQTREELVLVGKEQKVLHLPIDEIELDNQEKNFIFDNTKYAIEEYFFKDMESPAILGQEHMETYCEQVKKARQGQGVLQEIIAKVNKENFEHYLPMYEEKAFECDFFQDMADSYKQQVLGYLAQSVSGY